MKVMFEFMFVLRLVSLGVDCEDEDGVAGGSVVDEMEAVPGRWHGRFGGGYPGGELQRSINSVKSSSSSSSEPAFRLRRRDWDIFAMNRRFARGGRKQNEKINAGSQ